MVVVVVVHSKTSIIILEYATIIYDYDVQRHYTSFKAAGSNLLWWLRSYVYDSKFCKVQLKLFNFKVSNDQFQNKKYLIPVCASTQRNCPLTVNSKI